MLPFRHGAGQTHPELARYLSRARGSVEAKPLAVGFIAATKRQGNCRIMQVFKEVMLGFCWVQTFALCGVIESYDQKLWMTTRQ
jgi:hypothetical protein